MDGLDMLSTVLEGDSSSTQVTATPHSLDPTRQLAGATLQELQLIVSYLKAMRILQELQTSRSQNSPSMVSSILSSVQPASQPLYNLQQTSEEIVAPDSLLGRDIFNEVAAALIQASQNFNFITANVDVDGLTTTLGGSNFNEVQEAVTKLPLDNADKIASPNTLADYLFEIPYSSDNPTINKTQPSIHEADNMTSFLDVNGVTNSLQNLSQEDIDTTLPPLQSEDLQFAASSSLNDVLEEKSLEQEAQSSTELPANKLRSWPSYSSLSSGYSSDSPLNQELMDVTTERCSYDALGPTDDETQSSEWLRIPLSQWNKRQCREFLDWVWKLYELSSSPDDFDMDGAELLALSLEELQRKSEHGSMLYSLIKWFREPGFVIFYEDDVNDLLAVQDTLSSPEDSIMLKESRPEYVSKDGDIFDKKPSTGQTFVEQEQANHNECTCSTMQEGEAQHQPSSTVTLTPPPNGITSPCVPVSPSFIGSRLWTPEAYRANNVIMPALHLPRPPSYPVRNGLLPPIPPLIPSPTSPGMIKFTHFKQTLSPGKSPVVTNGDILYPSRRETTRLETFHKSPIQEKDLVSRKREHSPENSRHFSFEKNFVAAANKKAYVPNSRPMNEVGTSDSRPMNEVGTSDSRPMNEVGTIDSRPMNEVGTSEASSVPSPVFKYSAHSMPMVPNSPGVLGRVVPRVSRRDPVVPSRLSDYEVPHIRAPHHKISRPPIDKQDPLSTGMKHFKNGYHSTKNGQLDNRVVKKESDNIMSPSNKPTSNDNLESALSPKSSDEDSAISPVTPTSPLQRDYPTPKERTRRKSSSSTDSGTEEQRDNCTSPPKLSNGDRKTGRRKQTRSLHLWEFLKEMLENEETCPRYITWISPEEGVFRLVNSSAVAKLWGQRKNRRNMNYEKMSRALRYYYERHILERVPGQRLIYKFAPDTMKDCNFSFMKKST